MSATGPKLVYFNGEIVPYAEADIHVMSPAVKYGAAVYEGICAYWNEAEEQLYVFRLAEHTRRLQNSIKAMRMDRSFTDDELSGAVLQAIRANEFRQDLHIRQTVFVSGNGGINATGPVGMAVVASPRKRPATAKALQLGVSSWARIPDNAMPPRIKCVANYHNGRLAQLQADLDGYDVPLLLDGAGKVTEAPTATFFLVRNGTVITCPITSSILESVTRETVIQLFRDLHGIEVVEREINRSELAVADEAFLCGSSAEITAVASIDRYPLGDGEIGPLTRLIRESYFNVVRGGDTAYSQWRTAVYN